MSVQVINADVMDGLRQIPDESVQCVVTSPPYWGLRDYGTGTWQGGNDGCDHVSHEIRTGLGMAALGEKYAGGGKKASEPEPVQFRDVCGKCGAVKTDRQIGLEKTPAEFVARMVQVFEEVRRVLRKDGVCFVNLGDSYAATTKGSSGKGEKQISNAGTLLSDRRWSIPAGLKPKDLIGIPWRVALAMQDAGWWLRQDIIWAKPNPMPESVTDRCTKSHEYIFLLTKSARYFWDAEAIKEGATYDGPNSPGSQASPYGQGFTRAALVSDDRKDIRSDIESRHRSSIPGGQSLQALPDGKRNKRSVWTIATAPFNGARLMRDADGGSGRKVSPDCPVHGVRPTSASKAQHDGQLDVSPSGRSPGTDSRLDPLRATERAPTRKRRDGGSVPGSLDLIDLACAPLARGRSTQSRKTGLSPSILPHEIGDAELPVHIGGNEPLPDSFSTSDRIHENRNGADSGADEMRMCPSGQTGLSSESMCTCEKDNIVTDHFATFPPELPEICIKAGSKPGDTILDPFGGAGTTGLVADRLQRNAILIELNPTYAAMAQARVSKDRGALLELMEPTP